MASKKKSLRSRVKGEGKTESRRRALIESRLLELARFGLGRVSPNPLVGALIEKNGQIIAEGFHARFGGAHAEVLSSAARCTAEPAPRRRREGRPGSDPATTLRSWDLALP